ncbi:Serine/threonine-protein kinase ULK4 [Camelus dromedarius]|uniref:Serine/threonine-protein kinase ULK4 n=1 Tax=Camelus dromedarius TaxID=9838 RepID=A0A5N4EEK1_CAMDR|nr:Serine/threonine-protein kinase ULK4 [Camelus dromedarius]
MTEHNLSFTRLVEESKLIPRIFEVILEHQENMLGNIMQSVIALLNNLVACKDSKMKLLYEQGLQGDSAALRFSRPGILHGKLTYLSAVVRLALQAPQSGSGGSAPAAEDLLLLSKPLTDLVSLRIPLLPNEDPEGFEV